jgi:Lrp/AsnC family leucine-responsive transcriptional regulator
MNLQIDDPAAAQILRELTRDARQSMRQLSGAVGLSPPAVADRVRRLEDIGVIRGYRAIIDVAKLGWNVSAFVSLTARDGRCDRLLETLEAMPNVLAAYHIAGETDYLARVAAADLDALKRLTDTLAEVASVSTQIVLGESFERTPL